ncbi:MAG: gliding motility protein GldM [Bacteroidota bacterium]
MMYLVLTAMLALNVSKEVLDAFTLVDGGLLTTTENFAAKNEGLYDRFAIAHEQNPEKVGEWRDKAEEVRRRSNELYEFINECKKEIVLVKEKDAIQDNQVNLAEVEVKQNTDIPAQIMVVEKKGVELKNKIDEHREYMLSLIGDPERYATTTETVEETLNTEIPDIDLEHGSKKGAKPTWESTYFEHLPLAAVITLLSKMQGDVRNVEAEMLNFLLGQVGEGDIPVNTLEAVVIPESNYVFKGQPYRAQVFLAAYDSTKMPEVILNDGTVLDVEKGKGVYSTTSSTIGIRRWGGTIQLESEGNVISRSFETEYEVAEANATISATAMNVFYRGVDNPVAISAGGVTERDVIARISSPHTISRVRAGTYIVRPGSQGAEATVSVYANLDGTQRLMNRMNFRVRDLPVPDAVVEGVRGSSGNLTVGQLASLQEIRAEAQDFLFEVDFDVTSFTVAFQDRSGKWSYEESDNSRFTSAQKAIFRSLTSGQRIMFEDIKAIGPDGKVNTLNNITINVR